MIASRLDWLDGPRQSIQISTVLLSLLVAGSASAQTPQSLTLLRGADTIAVERYTAFPNRVVGELLFKAAGIHSSYQIHHPNGVVTRMEYVVRRIGAPDSTPPVRSILLVIRPDSVIRSTTGPDGVLVPQAFPARPGLVPFVNPSFAMMELGLRLGRATDKVDSLVLFGLESGQQGALPVVQSGGDTLVITLGALEIQLVSAPDGSIRGGRIPAQGLVINKTLTPSGVAPLRAAGPDYSAPPNAPYQALDLVVSTPAGHLLGGTLTLPESDRPLPAVITATGSGLQDRDSRLAPLPKYRPFYQLADALSRHQIAVLRMDDRGFGASGGNGSTATTEDFADDIRAGVAYLRSRLDIDPNRIVVLGHSEGGLIAPMMAATDSSLAGIVILAGPSKVGRDVIEYQNREAASRAKGLTESQRDSIVTAAMRAVDSAGAQQPWLRFFLHYDPLPTARRVSVPTLIVQGETDRQVTADQRLDLARAVRSGGNQDVTVYLVPETNHLFLHDPDGAPSGYPRLPEFFIRQEILDRITGWVVAHTAPQ